MFTRGQTSSDLKFLPMIIKVTKSHFRELGWGIRHFPVLIVVFLCIFGVITPKCQLKIIGGSLGVIHLQSGSESHVVFTNRFHSIAIITSKIIPFLRSIFTFPGKKVLPAGVTELNLLTGFFFRGFHPNTFATITPV